MRLRVNKYALEYNQKSTVLQLMKNIVSTGKLTFKMPEVPKRTFPIWLMLFKQNIDSDGPELILAFGK